MAHPMEGRALRWGFPDGMQGGGNTPKGGGPGTPEAASVH